MPRRTRACVLDYSGKVSTYHPRGGSFIVLSVRLNLYLLREGTPAPRRNAARAKLTGEYQRRFNDAQSNASKSKTHVLVNHAKRMVIRRAGEGRGKKPTKDVGKRKSRRFDEKRLNPVHARVAGVVSKALYSIGQ